jgi:hypothetical protein
MTNFCAMVFPLRNWITGSNEKVVNLVLKRGSNMICPIKPSTFGRIAIQDWDITDITIKSHDQSYDIG